MYPGTASSVFSLCIIDNNVVICDLAKCEGMAQEL